MKNGNAKFYLFIGIGVFVEILAFLAGMPVVMLLCGALGYGAILFIGYKVGYDFGRMFPLVLPLSLAYTAVAIGMIYVALHFAPLTPILMWSLDPPLLQ